MNGHELDATVDEGEKIIVALASGVCSREEFVAWVRAHMIPTEGKAS